MDRMERRSNKKFDRLTKVSYGIVGSPTEENKMWNFLVLGLVAVATILLARWIPVANDFIYFGGGYVGCRLACKRGV